jgi:hypothetical protein
MLAEVGLVIGKARTTRVEQRYLHTVNPHIVKDNLIRL